MQNTNWNSLNTLNFSNLQAMAMPFSICWVSMTSESTTDHLILRNHHHAFFELHFIVNGDIEYEVGKRKIALHKGEFILIPPEQIHNIITPQNPFWKFSVAFQISEHSELHTVCSSLSVGARKINSEIEKTLGRIFLYASQKSIYRAELTELSVRELMLRVLEIVGAGTSVGKSHHMDNRVLKAKTFIEDNTDIFFTCEEIARYCRVGTKQLGRLFKEYENMGLLEYIHFQKAEAAKHLLEDLDVSQKQLAQMLGFSDARYFGKFFFRMTGMTPGEYKKSLKRKEELST